MLIQKFINNVLRVTNKYKGLKKVCFFMYGFTLGIIFYEIILVDLDFVGYNGLLFGFIICLILSIGICVSVQIRCIALLSLPSFGGKIGRGVLKAIVIAYIVAGPIANISRNGREVARVFSCTTSLTVNLTKSRFELMFKPFQQALFGMKTEVNEIKDTVGAIRDITAPIAGEIEGDAEMKRMKEENDYLDELQHDTKRTDELEKKYNTKGEMIEAERYRKNYLKKVEMRCEDQLTKAGTKCRNMFASAYGKCYSSISGFAAWIICWPMKLTFVCNIIETIGGTKTCDPAKDMDPGFGEGYDYLKKSKNQLTKNFKDVRLQYKIGKLKQLQDIRDAADSAKSILHEVKRKKTLLDSFFKILKRVLAILFIGLLIDAQKYQDSYLRDINFDNIYVTRYFRKIDARRKIQNKYTLLPLKKTERLRIIIDPLTSFTILPAEKMEITGQTVRLLFEIITAIIILLFDRLFYEILDLIRRHARIDYTQIGHHDMSLDIKGVGMIATLLRNVFMKGFNFKKRLKVVRSNAQCLPQATKMPSYYFYKILIVYFGIWILILTNCYVKRFRRVICSFYYRKREKKRILFLYNDLLKKRIGYIRYMKKKLKESARKQRLEDNLNFFMILQFKYPRICYCLRLIPMARRKCIICSEPEPLLCTKSNRKFIKCPSPYCFIIYCPECWFDIKQTCFICVETDTSDDNDYDNSDSAI